MQYAENLGAAWRESCAYELKELGYFPLDICELDRAYADKNGELLYETTDISRAVDVSTELQAKSNIRKHFVRADLDLIEYDSDGLIVFYDESARRGAGTISECQHAFNRDIPIFLLLNMTIGEQMFLVGFKHLRQDRLKILIAYMTISKNYQNKF